ncbi:MULTISPECIES: DUF3820 family protein [unclassified Fibrobacter]|uniref:DUF3820 family protein n=1 Tax=unclassified Fibrobacter TaxID=2634177 RepID=UPI00091CAD3E|nr:DUF3820 family protein [Fibrobacter sp. UWH3]OWV03028.1 hypothetical protein B7993_14235 [Fibrobacter sp. UWH3]SHL15185.1 Uncharacterized conserved protein, DUF3820 family [Fibrobacter sp. UWH5]SHL41831.1 Uncharacterized conserved protein, DUF3820 family [Fibrobacter sp. UWH6]
MNPEVLLELANTTMPFGRYQGVRLIDLPEPYVVWYHSKGFPNGHLGELLGLLYEIKVNGLEPLLEPLKQPLVPKATKVARVIMNNPTSAALEKARQLRQENSPDSMDPQLAKALAALKESIR